MMRTTLLLASLLGATAAGADTLRAETIERVVDRCYTATVRYHALARAPGERNRAGETHLVEALKAAPHTERLIAGLAVTVRDLEPEERERLYDLAFVNCFVSGGESL